MQSYEVFAGNCITGEILHKTISDTSNTGELVSAAVDELTSKLGLEGCVWAIYIVADRIERTGAERLEDFQAYLDEKRKKGNVKTEGRITMSELEKTNLIEKFAEEKLGGTPSEIVSYRDGTYGVVYGEGAAFEYDSDEYIVRVVDGEVVLVV